jgi:hypothetical protein
LNLEQANAVSSLQTHRKHRIISLDGSGSACRISDVSSEAGRFAAYATVRGASTGSLPEPDELGSILFWRS